MVEAFLLNTHLRCCASERARQTPRAYPQFLALGDSLSLEVSQTPTARCARPARAPTTLGSLGRPHVPQLQLIKRGCPIDKTASSMIAGNQLSLTTTNSSQRGGRVPATSADKTRVVSNATASRPLSLVFPHLLPRSNECS
jgi:hypothetical protein